MLSTGRGEIGSWDTCDSPPPLLQLLAAQHLASMAAVWVERVLRSHADAAAARANSEIAFIAILRCQVVLTKDDAGGTLSRRTRSGIQYR